MKALTVSQPYAGLIADGLKFVENRRWKTSYRGWLAIHAGKGTQYLTARELRLYPTGCIVALVKLEACESLEDLQRLEVVDWRRPVAGRAVGEILGHEHCEGPECWIIGERAKFREPIPCKGAQGLWHPPPEIAGQLKRYLSAARLI